MKQNCSTGLAVCLAFGLLSVCETSTASAADVSGYEVVKKETPVSMVAEKFLVVKAPKGKKVVGAGWGAVDPTGAIMRGNCTYSMPAFDGSSWMVNVGIGRADVNWKLRLWVICVDVE